MGMMGNDIHPRTRRLLNGLLLALVVAASMFWFWAYLAGSALSPDRPQLFSDATRYLAAAERLSAGHDLYALAPGDRPVLTIPGVAEAPLLSPPPIAVAWLLVAAVPFGYVAWIVGGWFATFGLIAVLVLRSPLPAVPIAFALSLPIGEAVFGANAVVFYPLFYVLTWRYREHTWIGWLIAIMAVIKLAPIALGAWLLATRRYRALVVTAAGLVVLFGIAGLVAGFDSYLQCVEVLRSVGISPISVSGITGISWASYAVFGVGAAIAIGVGRRSDSGSYIAALLASVLGNPALYPGHLASLLALVAPFAFPASTEDRTADVPPSPVVVDPPLKTVAESQ
jgi:hypothetical protein